MFSNIGGKIKALAKVVCWIGIILSVISGGAMIAAGMGVFGYTGMPEGAAVVSGVLTIALGSLLSWIGSFFSYGFGELIEKTTEIARNTRHTQQ